MKRLMLSLLLFVFFLLSFTQVYAAIDVGGIRIDPSEKEYAKIKQLVFETREYPNNEKNLEYLEQALNLCNENVSRAEVYFLISEIKLYKPVKGEFKSYQDSLDLQTPMDCIDKAISLNENEAKYYGMKARIYRKENEFENAIVFYDKAIKLITEEATDVNIDLYHNRARYIYNKAQFYCDKAECEIFIKKKKEALEDIENAIKCAGEFDFNYNYYLIKAVELKEELGVGVKNILKDLDAIIKDGNGIKKYWAYLRKGVILEEQKKYGQAIEAYKAALDLDENDSSIKEYKVKLGIHGQENSLQNRINSLENKLNKK